MKKYIGLALIFGWFIAMEMPYEKGSTAKSRTVVGPFESENICKGELESLKDAAKDLGFEIKFSKCMYRQES